jgi:serine/threonine protein kinase
MGDKETFGSLGFTESLQCDFDMICNKSVLINCRAFGEVWYAFDKRSNQKVAIKKMEITRKNKKYIINEIVNQKAVSQHPNIVKYIECYFTDGVLWVGST